MSARTMRMAKAMKRSRMAVSSGSGWLVWVGRGCMELIMGGCGGYDGYFEAVGVRSKSGCACAVGGLQRRGSMVDGNLETTMELLGLSSYGWVKMKCRRVHVACLFHLDTPCCMHILVLADADEQRVLDNVTSEEKQRSERREIQFVQRISLAYTALRYAKLHFTQQQCHKVIM
ncbi:hypothetical protein T440DRAFT_297014 [Plenodomus tracheiphilus IPT5]|uniref:Uncharacterized protein n=1 Tax=Plenodomus tracheiphilus IPT5 TaxID=1408161 RepID=A0A6A7APB3_9PLEO|nr:hypothetical protein T440DRAFT_297014 [Plenodomus tracheiphilus IPT5]